MPTKKGKKKNTTPPKISWQLMDLALTILYLKNSKRKLLHKILKFQSLLMGQAGPSPIFTFKFSFLYNANYKLEALSI